MKTQNLMLGVLLVIVLPAAAFAQPSYMADDSGVKTEGLGIEFVDIAAQNFPYIYITAKATLDGQPIDSLAKDNFFIEEDGVLQTDHFTVTVPNQSGGVRRADIVFLIDTSSSMTAELAAVRANCIAFADKLAASNIDYRLGLIEFGHTGRPNPGQIGTGLTSDANTFKEWVDGLSVTTVSGNIEPGFEAIRFAIQNYDFRTAAQKVFLIITDEGSDDRDLEGTLDLIRANNVTVHAAADCGRTNDTCLEDYCDAGSVRGVSGGLLFPVNAEEVDYSAILDAIHADIANTYILSYRTTNDVPDAVEREVFCYVRDAPEMTDYDFFICYYTPGAAPRIERTQETLDLHNDGIIEGLPVLISARVTDAQAPFVEAATLHVRPTGTGGYTEISMVLLGNDIYAGQIDGAMVTYPGVDYYIRATDGQLTSSDPSVDRDSKPYQLAVLPNYPPVIEHVPEPFWVPTTDVNVELRALDSTNVVEAISVNYRREGELNWLEAHVTDGLPAPDITASVMLPTQTWEAGSIEYFIKATDDVNVASTWPIGGADQPYVLPAQELRLRISSSAGGQVRVPGEGDFAYDNAEEVAVEAVPDACYEFVGWTGTATEAGKVADEKDPNTVVAVDGDYTLIANFALLQYCLTISSTEGGSVIVPGEGVFCYGCGATVTIRVQPDPNHYFVGWPAELGGVVDANDPNGTTITFTINSDIELGPLFKPNNLRTESTPGGSIAFPDGQPTAFSRNTPVHIVAEAESCYHFVNWSGTAAEAGRVADVNDPNTTVVVDADYTLIASFAQDIVNLSVSSTGGGSVHEPGEATFTYDCGTCVALEAVADECFVFSHWAGSAVEAGKVNDPDDPNAVVCVDADYTLEAHFETVQYTLAITSGPGGCVVKPGEGDLVYECRETVPVEAKPDEHHYFAGWSGTAVEQGKVTDPADPNTIVLVDAGYTLHADFAAEQHTLVVTAAGRGWVYVVATGAGFVEHGLSDRVFCLDHGTEIQLLAIPDVGYRFQNFASWSGSFYGATDCWEFPLEQDWFLTAYFVAEPAP